MHEELGTAWTEKRQRAISIEVRIPIRKYTGTRLGVGCMLLCFMSNDCAVLLPLAYPVMLYQ